MEYDDVTEWISIDNGHLPTVDSQVTVGQWFVDNEISHGFNTRKRRAEVEEALENRIPHTVKRCLSNLEEIGVLKEYTPPGNGSFIRHERTDEVYFPPFEGSEYELEQLYATDVARFILDLRSRDPDEGEPEKAVTDGGEATFRQVAGDGLSVDGKQVENELLDTTVPDGLSEEALRELALEREAIIGEGISKYSRAVSEIDVSSEYVFERDYDVMSWGNSALKYALSNEAHHLEFTHTLDEFEE